MKSPNKFITIFFICAVAYAIYQIFDYTGNPGKKLSNEYEKIIDTSPNNSLSAEITSQEPSSTDQTEEAPSIKKTIKEFILGKNPFSSPDGINPYKKNGDYKYKDTENNTYKTEYKKSPKGENHLDFKVTSIMITKKKRIAIIDQSPFEVTIGDYIQNERVYDILPDRIIIGTKKNRRVVYLEFSKDSQIKMEGVK